MVHFGTPRPRDDDPVRALTCAAAMIDEMKRWNLVRASEGHEPIEIGIGLHYGKVVVGNIGHAQRLEFTAPYSGSDTELSEALRTLIGEAKERAAIVHVYHAVGLQLLDTRALLIRRTAFAKK